MDISDNINETAEKILDCAFDIHRTYGPGLLESAYEKLLIFELSHELKMKVDYQKTLPLIHKGHKIDAGYRIDLIVEDCVIIELKCVEKLLPIHQAQIMTYMKLTKIRLGLLLNFKETLLKNGIKRIII